MKTWCNILVSLAVSLMTVYLGAGALTEQCRHSGETTTVDTDCCHNHAPQPDDCMEVSIVNLQPGFTQHAPSIDAPRIDILPLMAAVTPCLNEPTATYSRIVDSPRKAPPKPPRLLLSKIQSFLI